MAATNVIADVAVRAANFAVQTLKLTTSLGMRAAGQLWARRASVKHWHVWAALATIFSLFFGILAFWTSLDGTRYARWTAQKDLCSSAQTRYVEAVGE
jgi:hypothetical protein